VCVRVYVRACVRAHDAHVRGGARFLRVGVRVARLLPCSLGSLDSHNDKQSLWLRGLSDRPVCGDDGVSRWGLAPDAEPGQSDQRHASPIMGRSRDRQPVREPLGP